MEPTAIFPPDRVTIVGVLNTTPDSFSDGGRFASGASAIDVAAAVDAAVGLVRDGAHVLDVGGESTRPGAHEVPVAEEIARTAPVVEALAKRLDVTISIDTRKAPVAEAALGAGASIVNDVSGLGFDPELAACVAGQQAGLVLGHLRGTPETMQETIHFDDALAEILGELERSVAMARRAGVPAACLAVDPGLGFGKGLAENLGLIANAGWLRRRLGLPLLLGPSRKSFLGALTGEPAAERDAATAAACAVAAFAGADAVRVHDVAGARRAVIVGRALGEARSARGEGLR